MTDQQLFGYTAHAESSLSSYLREFSVGNVADPVCPLPGQEHHLIGAESFHLNLSK